MTKIFLFSALCLSILFSGCQTKQTTIKHILKKDCAYYSLRSAQCKSTKQMRAQLKPYKVIFIGDHHDQSNLHANIAHLIKEFSRSGVRVKLANEWFYPSDNKVLEAYAKQDINETEFLIKFQWKKRLKYYTFDSFNPMYQATINGKGSLYGINLSKQQKKAISDTNISAMSQEERDFYNNLDLNVSAHQGLVMPFLSHCHAPKKGESLLECSARMYKVQVAWDSKMALEAYKLSLTLKDNEKLIVFAGAMHMEQDLGIPLRFARLSNEPFVTIIPAQNSTQEMEHKIGDYLMFYQSESAIIKN